MVITQVWAGHRVHLCVDEGYGGNTFGENILDVVYVQRGLAAWRCRAHRRHEMSQQQMRIGISLRGHGYHLAAWWYPDVLANTSVRIDYYVRAAKIAERGARAR